ncbi:protein FAR-RED ELONGATED HYPOCOTYL 3-like [Citrus sinensis]|uniref:protein FAR-RED ELONGATED HYPOCOTYL 3-like n=1 Tax=Citrus sinensis TaxID=2711 RepID=UPI0022779836|nr:protein FAR-RED ELONGATED HYPOCOTYL 3-like [Citrus sinensis]
MQNFENECVIEDVPLEKFEPTLGMLFDGYEEMFEFYKAYGRQEGFPVKKLTRCGLISHEDTETFTWLFEAWLSCMSDSPPIGIITDKDKAMQKTIEHVFPTTRHRWCLWHIMKKVSEKLGAFKEREGIISSLLSVVYDSLSPAAFEEDWNDMITTYDLWDNAWLNGLYDERYPWFVKQYENVLRRKAELEWQADAKCFSKNTPCVTRYKMEKQVEKMYTIAKFKEFQQELTALMYCDTMDFVGSIYEISESLGQGNKKNFEVVFGETECKVSCICSKFQFRRILCRHALSVLIRHGIEILPEMYILSRWRKDVKRCYSKVKVSYGMQNLSIQQERYGKMCIDFTEDLQENASASFEMANEVSTQQSNIQQTNMAMMFHEGSNVNANLNQHGSLGYYNVPVYPFQVGGNNIYQPIPYSWNTIIPYR